MKVPINKHLLKVQPSQTLAINELSKSLQSKGNQVYRFGFGQSPFPVPNIVQNALKENAYQKDYLPVQGLAKLREAIANHTNNLLKKNQFTEEQIFVGPGSKELIFLLQMILDVPLILPAPSWVSYAPQSNILKKKVHWISTKNSNWKLTGTILEDYISTNQLKSGLLILNYPSNPTGLQMSTEELSDIAQVCRRNNIIVIADEIYGLLSFDGLYRSVSTAYPEGTIITSGLSKWCGAGGWRLGYAAIPEELGSLIKIMCALASETFSAVSAPIQFAAVEAYLESEELDVYRRSSTSILKRISNYCTDHLTDKGVAVTRGEGGFYLFPDFNSCAIEFKKNNIQTSTQMCHRILQETGVALLPGSAFGRPENEFTARLSFVDFDGGEVLAKWKENMKQTEFKRLIPTITEGIFSLHSWARKFNIETAGVSIAK